LIYTAYVDLEKWFLENGKTEGDYAWEEYITDPSTEPDQSKWYTKVYYPIKIKN
jgi:effector-binding domain-containing protein